MSKHTADAIRYICLTIVIIFAIRGCVECTTAKYSAETVKEQVK